MILDECSFHIQKLSSRDELELLEVFNLEGEYERGQRACGITKQRLFLRRG